MPLSDEEHYLAQNCYGYGRWNAPYWFIGLEEGQDKKAESDLELRYNILRELVDKGRTDSGLCDIAEFHNDPRLEKIEKPWFRGEQPPTQSTWRYLILLLDAYLGKDKNVGWDSVRKYQRHHWGRRDESIGDTCIIELSGMAANSARVQRDRHSFIEGRLASVRTHLEQLVDLSLPTLVTMYGMAWGDHSKRIAGQALGLDAPKKILGTTFLFMRHPVDFFEKGESKADYFKNLGILARMESNR